MNRLGIAGLGIIGPGIGSWRDAVSLLTGAESFSAQAQVPQAVPTSLPANERRRVSPLIRMVLQCCEETLAERSSEFPAVRSVFASSCGDLVLVDKILRALAMPGKPVSPTLFHNSVHNSVAGYFSIARGDCSSSISVSARDSSFVAGLLSTAGLVLSGAGPTLLVAYDCTAPPRAGAIPAIPRIIRRWDVADRLAGSVVDVDSASRGEFGHRTERSGTGGHATRQSGGTRATLAGATGR